MEAFVIICTLFVAGMILSDLREFLGANRREAVKERIRRKRNFYE